MTTAEFESVYVISAGPELVKVGRSWNVAKRLVALQQASSSELIVVLEVKVADAARFERAVHGVLKPHRRKGEWFACNAATAELAVKLAMEGKHKQFEEMSKITALTKPGRYSVGHGVYLQIGGKNARSWVFRYEREYQGKRRGRHIGLGSCSSVTLQDAHKKAHAYRDMLGTGTDPLEWKNGKMAIKRLASKKLWVHL